MGKRSVKKYLKKRKVYEFAEKLLRICPLDDCCVPSLVYCDYKRSGGYEWLRFFTELGHVTVTVKDLGVWARLYVKSFEDEVVYDKCFNHDFLFGLISEVCGSESEVAHV